MAPWAARVMPGLFALNERVLLLGQWEHGFFSFAAVGALIVGSVSLTIDEVCKVFEHMFQHSLSLSLLPSLPPRS